MKKMKEKLKRIFWSLSPSYRMECTIRDILNDERIERENNLRKYEDRYSDIKNKIDYLLDDNKKRQNELLEEFNGIKKASDMTITKDQYNNLITGQLFQDSILSYIDQNWNNQLEQSNLKRIYNRLKVLETVRFEPFITDRIDELEINEQLDSMHERFCDYKFYIVSDRHINSKYPCIKVDDIKQYNDKNNIFVLCYNKDWEALEAVKVLVNMNLKYLSIPHSSPMARYFDTDENSFLTLEEERENEPIDYYFCPIDFENIFQALNMTRKLDGAYVEIGTFKGASARAALRYMKKSNIKRESFFIDLYEGFVNQEAEESNDAFWYGTHTETSVKQVKDYLKEFGQQNVNVIKSNIISDNLPDGCDKICVCNIDVDIYDAVKAALFKVHEKICKYGVIIAEDYGHTPLLIGAQQATKEFLDVHGNDYIQIYQNSGQLILIRK